MRYIQARNTRYRDRMPCNCKLPVEKYPETAEWAPLFWNLLHGLAEHAGTIKDTLLQQDERRTWIRCMKELGPTLPCDVCRTHYGEWVLNHDFKQLMDLPYSQFGPWIRNYFFTLHNEINGANGRPLFEAGDLKKQYGSVQITPLWKGLEPVLTVIMRHYKLSYMDWKVWQGYVRTLQGLYGIH